jgi:hypothetical protein
MTSKTHWQNLTRRVAKLLLAAPRPAVTGAINA